MVNADYISLEVKEKFIVLNCSAVYKLKCKVKILKGEIKGIFFSTAGL